MYKSVSVVILAFNGELYIRETIDSCLNQTYKNVEIFVVDDCSADNTVKILEEYGKKINLVVNKLNRGIVANVNKMTLSLSSDYFILLGHDDILPSGHIETMVYQFNDPQIMAVHCNSQGIDAYGKYTQLNRMDSIQVKKTEYCMFELSIDNFISSCGMMHRVDLFHKLHGWDSNYRNYGEWLYYIKLLEFGKIKYTQKTRALYRRHETNITNTFKDKDVAKSLNLYKSACRKLAHSLNSNSFSENIKYYLNESKLKVKAFIK